MKNKVIVLTAIILIIAVVNYIMIIADSTIRTVEFLSIFAIGVLSGVLITQIANVKKQQ